jgi:hypothetical protein
LCAGRIYFSITGCPLTDQSDSSNLLPLQSPEGTELFQCANHNIYDIRVESTAIETVYILASGSIVRALVPKRHVYYKNKTNKLRGP